ncbi:hypothetical protein BT96DRAFT_922083 [Gymnopus androsaceus JB14]|uniref:Uncharacterized protein n=1 Tax=Gymnopus androsaceus JB14 TaxID=1447944 RepID=A0A6A4HFB4_9AGAR|nr:hypothetical protein BT96DRAFT_922083 [Gymnopus androsaceus JB14]
MGGSSFGSTIVGIVIFGVTSICFCILAVSSVLDFSMSFRTCSSNVLDMELGRQQLQQEVGATVSHQLDSAENNIVQQQPQQRVAKSKPPLSAI